MVGERELVALLYRADWTRLCLSGDMRGLGEPVLSALSHMMPNGPGPSGEPADGPPFSPFGPGLGGERDVTLLMAPGRRYREEGPDGRFVRGCDGERGWFWLADPPAGGDVHLTGDGPPFPTLLAPSWLLDGYQLSIEGETTLCGRAGVRVAAMPSPRGAFRRRGVSSIPPPPRWLTMGGLSEPLRPWWWRFVYDQVSCVVDAELGVLLRCERLAMDRAPEVAEFVSLALDPEIDPALFTAPPGSVFDGGPFGDGQSGWSPGGFGREAAKTAAGLAAGGLGAVIKYGPRRHPDPFERATAEDDPEPEMPLESFPSPAPAAPVAPVAPVSDEMLHLLYRNGAATPDLSCTLHQWFDLSALLEAVPESARKTGFGGVGLLVDAVIDAARSAGANTHHQVRSVRIGGWDRYRIDRTYPRRRPDDGQDELLTLACDGQQRWEVYADRVVVGPPGAPEGELADLLDGSWLLGTELAGGEEIVAGGRRAYRVTAVAAVQQAPPAPFGWLVNFTLPAVAVVDAESGRLLRLTTYKRGKPVALHELRDVSPGGGDDFGFEVPAGMPVETAPESESGSESGESRGASRWGEPGWSGWRAAGSRGSWRPPWSPRSPWSPWSPGTPWSPGSRGAADAGGVNPVEFVARAAADAVKKQVDEKAAAARAFLDSLRGGPKPPPPAS